MSFQDLVKFATEEMVRQIDKPKVERLAERQERKEQKASFSMRAFGVMPMAFALMKRQKE
ncbi:YqzE family protein [Shouchella shacheensis]|uniref:YqzE family protein n=1 Tax=Shouchella shacheensis TaxID=1649580 RepID=UPI00073FDFE8|nr:YqzE family protein [Shouchella shacheensis]